MWNLDPSIELAIQKHFTQLEKDLKEDRHKQNNKIQNVIIKQEKRLESAIIKMQSENAALMKEISWLFAKKWVERIAISIGTFIIFWVGAIFWNVFSDVLTDTLEWTIQTESDQ